MSGTRAAIRYARAILDLANAENKAASIREDMLHIVQTITNHSELQEALKSPVVKQSEKAELLKQVFSSLDAEIKSLFSLLIRNKRVDLLVEIANQYQLLYAYQNNQQEATVTTAIPMTKSLETKVLLKLKTLSTKKLSLKQLVDPTILGGFVLRVGDQQYDASVSSKLNKLKSKFITN